MREIPGANHRKGTPGNPREAGLGPKDRPKPYFRGAWLSFISLRCSSGSSAMRRGIHLAIGILAFCLYAVLGSRLYGISPGLTVLGLCAVIAGSLMPDLLERPTSSRHRGIFHSRRALKVSGIVFCLAAFLYLLPDITSRSAIYGISCFALGYMLHLGADATTRRGLPD
ncbi:metal-dependent hydrolase [Methanoregula sp.]|uniref:metal-dependent hydrolase n=1 Tax=Methanoregula sp. TaxID=2052170 RepID=UPI002C312D2B|nr:metal-dependent hydrolase [Methanoregula sp.]HVP97484.1 metal-dependent hydrolase [Methanoregula sp.]